MACIIRKPKIYTTTFVGTETPISEGGSWLNGATDGLSWKDMQISGGLAYGPANFLTNNYDDATATLKGTWSPNQRVEAVVHTVSQQTGANFQEVEIRLRTTITPGKITGYEILWRCTNDGSQYHQIGSWFGSLGSNPGCGVGCAFDAVPGSINPSGNGMQVGDGFNGTFDGDTVGAQIIGNRITTWIIHLGVKQILNDFDDVSGANGQAQWLNGNPGIGHWLHGAGLVNDFGFTRLTAMEL